MSTYDNRLLPIFTYIYLYLPIFTYIYPNLPYNYLFQYHPGKETSAGRFPGVAGHELSVNAKMHHVIDRFTKFSMHKCACLLT